MSGKDTPGLELPKMVDPAVAEAALRTIDKFAERGGWPEEDRDTVLAALGFTPTVAPVPMRKDGSGRYYPKSARRKKPSAPVAAPDSP